jgi:hypothetical protein
MMANAWNPLGFHFLDARPKDNTLNAAYSRVTILSELLPLRPPIGGRRLVIHADKARPRTAGKYRAFAKKIGSALPYTHRTHLISEHPISFSSDISNIVCRESFFNLVKNYLQRFMKSSGPSGDHPCRTCFGTGRRDPNEFLKKTVTAIHNLNTG